MEARRIVRFIIVIFCVLTVLFFSLYRKEAIGKSCLTEEFVSGAVLNLRNSGVSVSTSVIDKSIPEKDIYTFELTDRNTHYNKISDAIIKVLFGGSATKAGFDVPEGISYGIFENEKGSRELGRVVFSGSDLSFGFSKNGVSINGVGSAIMNEQIEAVTAEQLKIIDNLVKEMSDSRFASYRLTGSSSNDEYVIITVMQVIDGHDICDVYMNFIFENNEAVDLSGSWITGAPKAEYHNKLVDGVNVLYKLNLDEISAVTDESIVYLMRKSRQNKYFIIPGWQITCIDKAGMEKTVVFDAL